MKSINELLALMLTSAKAAWVIVVAQMATIGAAILEYIPTPEVWQSIAAAALSITLIYVHLKRYVIHKRNMLAEFEKLKLESELLKKDIGLLNVDKEDK